MSSLPVLPNMLIPERLKKLNDHLIETTGCFAFLKTDQVLFSPAPQSWQDAFTIFSIGLYAVYHDFGCNFLRFPLDDDFCPNEMPKPHNHRNHIDMLNREIRTNLAHGLLLSSQRTNLQIKLANYLVGNVHDPKTNDWPNYINQLSETHWRQITEHLIEDSNSLYSFLLKWGDTWAKHPNQLPKLRAQFASSKDYFLNSFNERICRPLLLIHGVNPRDISKYISKNSNYIRRWQTALSQAYLSGTTPPDKLIQKLDILISQELQPTQKSSLDIAAQFDLVLD